MPEIREQPSHHAGAAVLTAVVVAAVLAVLPFAQTLATLGPTMIRSDPRYVQQILAVQAPTILAAPIAAGIVAALSFAVIAPIRGSLRMAQAVRRGFATAAVAFVVAELATLIGGILAATIGGLRLAGPALSARSLLMTAVAQGGSQLPVLLAVPLAAILLWGWLRREPSAAAAAPIPPEV
jgi:hypothetical protein